MNSRAGDRKLPMGALLALTTAAFVTVFTEAVPAGVLVGMSIGLDVSESAIGQAVTIYAIGTAISAIPLSAVTARWRRRRLLLMGIGGFIVGNTLTAISTMYAFMMVGRFVSGIAAGLVWALLAGYARRMVPEDQQGKAIAIVMAGIPLALSLGVPAGTFLGEAFGWRVTFSVMSVLAIVLMAWILLAVPDFPGQNSDDSMPFMATLRMPGIAAILFVTLIFVLAHNMLYTYIATFLRQAGIGDSIGVVLLIFGVASIVSIFVVGVYIDRQLRVLTIVGTILVAGSATILAVFSSNVALVYAAIALWGLGWGGVPTLLQTAVGDAGREYADLALAMLVTLWNVAMAAGGIVGGILLAIFGPLSFPWSVLALMLPVLIVVIVARTHGFPARQKGMTS